MSFIVQPASSVVVGQTKEVISSSVVISTGYRGLSQSSVTIATPGSVQIPSGEFWQILQTN